MPTNKDFKRLVRGRMQKTGESYTAARAQLLHTERALKQPVATEQAPERVPPAQFAELAGMSDAKLKKATGCDWQRWVHALDDVEAHKWPHPQIAKYVHEEFKTPSWWTQTVTVGYERIKGLRAVGQQRDGTFQARKSKVLPVSVTALYQAFDNGRRRSRWLGAGFTVRSAAKGKRMVLVSPDGEPAEVLFTSKGPAKSQVNVELRKLGTEADAARWKEFWADRVERLAELLSPARATA